MWWCPTFPVHELHPLPLSAVPQGTKLWLPCERRLHQTHPSSPKVSQTPQTPQWNHQFGRGKHPEKKRQILFSWGMSEVSNKSFFFSWKSWKNPGGSKFSCLKFFWPHWCWHLLVIMTEYLEISQITSKFALTFETIRRHSIWLSSTLCQSTLRRKDTGIPLENRLSSALVQLKDPSICPPTRPTSLSIPAFTEPIEPRLLLSYNPCTKCHSSHVLSR